MTILRTNSPVTSEIIVDDSITGGFPTQEGFSLTSDITNLESSNSQETVITGKLVDEFNNPVKTGTAVYFTTDIGSIQGSDAAQSDENGEVSVAFWCDGNTGSGTITGFTVNANNEQITASLPVICSNSEALIVATPSEFTIEQGQTQLFELTITDIEGYPMPAGSTVEIEDGSDSYVLTGNTSVTIANTIQPGAGLTDFEFVLEFLGEQDEDIIIPINVTAPSGYITSFNITGSASSGVVPGDPAGAASITLESISETTININETGGTTNSVLTFEVQDSSGRAIDIANQVEVRFEVANGPGGGEGFSPETVLTDSEGKAITNFFSGDSAGVVQIKAIIERTDVGLIIESNPIAIVIEGGFPVLEGFDVKLDVKNIERQGSSPVIVTLADQFGNPVKVGTAVYFSTNLGIVNGNGFTNNNGKIQGISLECSGLGNLDDGGSGVLTASTADANENEISVDIPFICSSSTALITATPTAVDITAGGSQEFNFTVTNTNGDPMPKGTQISVVHNGNVALEGDFSVELGDYSNSGTGRTEFTFSLLDNGSESEEVDIDIVVTSPVNGIETINNDITVSIYSDDDVAGPPAGAASIILTNVTEEVINIQGTGGKVNSAFTFEVQDSAGRTLDLDNQIEVNFSILVGPDGGEGLLPESAMTNSEGRVTTSLFSGTKAGVVQVQAEIVRDDLTPPLNYSFNTYCCYYSWRFSR